MQLLLRRTEQGFIPVFDDDVTALAKVPIGNDILVEYKPKRNVQFHKKYYALLNAVLPNQQFYKTVDNLHEAVKFRAGYFDTLITHKGEKFLKAKSISFSTMDEVEFEMFYQRALDVCVELTDDDAVTRIIGFM